MNITHLNVDFTNPASIDGQRQRCEDSAKLFDALRCWDKSRQAESEANELARYRCKNWYMEQTNMCTEWSFYVNGDFAVKFPCKLIPTPQVKKGMIDKFCGFCQENGIELVSWGRA